MKITLICPNCQNKKVIPMQGLINSKNIEKLFKENNTTCEICKGNGLGNIPMNVSKFDREKQTESIRESGQLHVPTVLDKDSMTPEQIAKKEKLRKELGL